MKKRGKGGFIEISFAWLFGIIAGAAILALAIFAATRIINIGQTATGAETQAEIGVLLNPLETSFQTGQVVSLTLPLETRIYNECDYRDGIFGEQTIGVSQLNLGKWSVKSDGTSFQNKYIFSENVSEGKQFFLFSKPFEFPFKVSDVIYMTSLSEEYCFVKPSEEINEELSNLNQKNIKIVTESPSECKAGSIKICFHGEDCDVEVAASGNGGTVNKKGEQVLFYEDALMYGAIFSDKKVYECQLKRLMERTTQLSSLYLQKGNTIRMAGCNSDLTPDLSGFSSLANIFSDSEDLGNLVPAARLMEQKNDATTCKLW